MAKLAPCGEICTFLVAAPPAFAQQGKQFLSTQKQPSVAREFATSILGDPVFLSLLIFLAVLLLLVGVVVLVGMYSSIKKRSAALPAPDTALSSMIPYTNPRALTAYYCSIFSIIPCMGLVLGPAAVLLGILGLRFVSASPAAKGTVHAVIGIALGAITTLANLTLAAMASFIFLTK